MMNFRLSRVTVLLCAVAVQQGCGGSKSDGEGGGGGSSIKSGLPPDKSVSGLTDAEAQKLCETEGRAAVELSSTFCKFAAFAEAISVGQDGQPSVDTAACESGQAACADAAEQPVVESCSGAQADPDCDITVQEYETCLNATIASAVQLFQAVSCDKAPTQDQFQNFDPNALPSQCNGLDQRCPGAFGGGSDVTPPPSESGCDDTCSEAMDEFCDDGGEGSVTDFCGLGTDCTDCGPR
jgi:hypothetical protein